MKNIFNHEISFLGEFKDKALEREFFNYDMGRAVRFIRPAVLVLGILNMMFIIPDYFSVNDPSALKFILADRTIFLGLVIVLFFKTKKVKDFTELSYWITVYEFLCIVSFLLVFLQYKDPDFLIQSFGIMVIILGIYLVPNKWINIQVNSIVIILLFFIFSFSFIKELKASELLASIVYTFLVMVICSIWSFQTNYYKRKQYADKMELLKLSVTDPLTGIYNRAKFDAELEDWVKYCRRYETPLSLVLFDFDDFKAINDKFGHLAGDKVIVETSNIVKSIIRQTDVFARWGGEEFVILLPNTEELQAMEMAERLRSTIENNNFGYVERVTCSFGLTALRKNENSEDLMLRVDKLLYEAKKSGKNTIAC